MEATTYEGRRQMDKVTARAAADQAAANRKKSEALTDIEIGEAREAARDRERRRKETARTKALEEKNKRRERKAVARKARNERLSASVGQPLPWVLTVVVASVAVAWPGQFSAMTSLEMNPVLALLVPVFIEGSTWSMAWLTKWAVENNKPAGLYRIVTWIFALVAAGLNASHHLDKPDLAVTMALSSLVGVVVWEIYMHSQQHKAGGRSAEEIKLALQRRLRHRKVSRRARWLRTATVPALSEDEAWTIAWRQIRGAEPGVTQGILKRHNKQSGKVSGLVAEHDALAQSAGLEMFAAPAQPVREVAAGQEWAIRPQAIEKVLTDPALALREGTEQAPARKIDKSSEAPREDAAQSPHAGRTRAKSSQVASSYPPPAQGRQKGAGKGERKQVRAARAAAADTARAATPEKVEADRRTVRAWAVEQLRTQPDLGWRALQDHFETQLPENERLSYGETWYRKQLTAAREDLDRPLHVVREDELAGAGVG